VALGERGGERGILTLLLLRMMSYRNAYRDEAALIGHPYILVTGEGGGVGGSGRGPVGGMELKNYDAVFAAAFNRPPQKRDKEPLRPGPRPRRGGTEGGAGSGMSSDATRGTGLGRDFNTGSTGWKGGGIRPPVFSQKGFLPPPHFPRWIAHAIGLLRIISNSPSPFPRIRGYARMAADPPFPPPLILPQWTVPSGSGQSPLVPSWIPTGR